jgi:hypothetical protein
MGDKAETLRDEYRRSRLCAALLPLRTGAAIIVTGALLLTACGTRTTVDLMHDVQVSVGTDVVVFANAAGLYYVGR